MQRTALSKNLVRQSPGIKTISSGSTSDYNSYVNSIYEESSFKKYPIYSPVTHTLFKKYLEEVGDLSEGSIVDLYEDKKAVLDDERFTFRNTKVKERKLLYENGNIMIGMGLINNEGEVNDDKECEYEYYIKELGGRKVEFRTVLSVLILLFML